MGTDLEQLERRLARLEAKEAVLAAFNRYLYAIDVGYPDELIEGVFTADAVLEVINFPPGTMQDLKFTGRDEIRPLYVEHSKGAPAIQGGHHATNISVNVAEDASSATLSAYFLTAQGTNGRVQGGQYQGEAVPDGDVWRFRRYRVLSGWGWRRRRGAATDLRTAPRRPGRQRRPSRPPLTPGAGRAGQLDDAVDEQVVRRSVQPNPRCQSRFAFHRCRYYPPAGQSEGRGRLPTSADRSQPSGLLGRRSECGVLDRVLTDARAGRSRVVVVRGEAGVGKSALLRYVSGRVEGWQVATAVGIESEMELAYSGLHQLCAPLLEHLDELPPPQREALETVFGLGAGAPPDRFLVGLATLTLFASVADQQPLVCIVDDAQWLDRVSAQILGFVARRLLAERVAVVCAARTGIGDDVLGGLPELALRGLADRDARALLMDRLHVRLDAAVCDQIVADSHGNPLALFELPRTWNPSELAGGFGLPGGRAVTGKIEQSYIQRLEQLPPDTRLLVLTAAAEPLGDPVLLHRAAVSLGIVMAASEPAVDAGLLKVGGRVRFAHPLVRSVAYRSAAADDRHRVHLALADATDPETDPDRRAWHRAHGTPRTSEEVAVELVCSASRAQARGGVAAAAAFLQRAVALTDDPVPRGERALAAAEAHLQAGSFDAALGTLATAKAAPLDAAQRARVELVRAEIAFAAGYGSDAPPLLLAAARGLEPFDLDLARETYLAAWGAAEMTGSLAGDGLIVEISRAIRALPPTTGAPRPLDLLLDGLALFITDGHSAAAGTLQRAAKAATGIPLEDILRWGWIATYASSLIWDSDSFEAIAARHVQLVRNAGVVAQLPLHLWQLALLNTWMGDFAAALSLAAESESVGAATGSRLAPYTLLRLRALQGREADFSALLASATELAVSKGQGTFASRHWGAAVLHNGLGRYAEAAREAEQAASDSVTRRPAMWALPELVEAAVRSGDAGLAHDALDRLTSTTQPCQTDLAQGIEARSRALVSDDSAAEDLYRESIERLGRTRLRPDLARAHLLYGEWLRREGRRVDARQQLRTAHDLLSAIGMEAFAERARRELISTGEKVRKRRDEERQELTPQEEQIARLARDGLSNTEIGAQLFISARTVEWHLRKVFTKLDISSRRQLRTARLADGVVMGASAR